MGRALHPVGPCCVAPRSLLLIHAVSLGSRLWRLRLLAVSEMGPLGGMDPAKERRREVTVCSPTPPPKPVSLPLPALEGEYFRAGMERVWWVQPFGVRREELQECSSSLSSTLSRAGGGTGGGLPGRRSVHTSPLPSPLPRRPLPRAPEAARSRGRRACGERGAELPQCWEGLAGY